MSVTRNLQTAATGNGDGTPMPVSELSHAAFQVTGTFVANINIEGTINGADWLPLRTHKISTGVVTAPGVYGCNCVNYKSVRARISNYVSGSITVVGYAVDGQDEYAGSTIYSSYIGQAGVGKQQRGSLAATTADSGASSPNIPSWAVEVWLVCKSDFIFAVGEAVDADSGIDVPAGQVLWPIDAASGDKKLHLAMLTVSDTIRYTFLGD